MKSSSDKMLLILFAIIGYFKIWLMVGLLEGSIWRSYWTKFLIGYENDEDNGGYFPDTICIAKVCND